MKIYRKVERLIEDINKGKAGNTICFKGVKMELQPVFWNNTYCYIDKTGENYINLTKNKQVSRFCVKEIYINL